MSKIGKLRQRIGAFDFTEPLNKNNELGRRLRKKRIDETQPHIGRGEPYKRKGRVVSRSPPSRDFYNTLPFEPTKPGTMEEDQYERQLTKKFPRPKIREKDRKPGTLFDNEGGLQDREFAADSLDDPSILDPEKWSGEDLKKLEDMTATPSLTNYTHKQPLRDSFIQESPGGVGISDPHPNIMSDKADEEMKYIENPQYKIKPIKPTRMDWRAIISAKQLRQRIAQVRLAVTYGKGQSWLVSPEVINAFKNREPFRLHQKQKGRNAEYAFQTDGDTLFQLSKKEKGLPQKRYEIASWDEKEDLNWSFEGRDSASTIQAGKMLGLDIKRKEGKMFVNGEYMDHLTRGKPMKIPRANLKGENKSKTRSKITPKQYEDTKAQTRFRQRSESYWKKQKGILGDQITDPETGEIYDQASIQPYQQRQINKTLGLSEEHDVGEKIIGDEYDHPIPARIVKKMGGSRDFGIGTPLSHKTHIEREDPASTIPKAFRRRIQKARLKIARIRQRNISRRVTQINMAKEDYDPVQAWASMIRDLKGRPAHQLEGNWTYLDGDLVDFDRPGSKKALMKSVKGNPKLHIFTVSNTHGIKKLFNKGVVNPELQKRYDQLSSLNIGKATIGKWTDPETGAEEYDATVNFRDRDNKKAEEIARGVKGDIPQQAYYETYLNDNGVLESKLHNYNKETDTYE